MSKELEKVEEEIAANYKMKFENDLKEFAYRSGYLLGMLDRMKRDCRFWDFFESSGVDKHYLFEAWMVLEKLGTAFMKDKEKDSSSLTMPQ
jgi:hypothetical protein